MNLRPQTLGFLRELERSAARKLNYPEDVGHLLEASGRARKLAMFEEAIFLAKFITKSLAVMKRIGVDGEGYDKLSAEFQTSLRRAASLLGEISLSAPAEIRQSVEKRFLDLTQESVDRLMKLMADLTAVKSWVLDGNPLPSGDEGKGEPPDHGRTR
jgi:hypothetical protein